jgi:CubicO group peptidase (beta-lactamase class C family)
MSQGGLSKARLGRMHDAMQAYVDRGEVPGVITAVERRGELHVDVIGLADRERKIALKRDAIMRIASMTKPITAAATMILVEECKLRLDEPVDRLLPELANRKVLKRIDGPLDDTVPANRPITVRDLLTFRLGFGFVLGPPGPETPIQKAQNELQLMGLKPFPPWTPDEWMKRLGTLPLMYQPGERWLYHTGSDILGVLIARAAGMPLEDFFKTRIFEPLGMKDTGFHVPANKLDRLSTCYVPNPKTRELDVYDDARDSQWAKAPKFPVAGGGLVSTVDDYLAFARMMLGYGKLGHERILSRPSVEAMISDQLTPAQKAVSVNMGGWDVRGYGFGIGMVTKRDSGANSPGRFGWDGAFGTQWASDPKEEMTSILMIQRMGMGPVPSNLGADFWTLAYQAIDD